MMRITEINPAKSGLSCRDARNLFDAHLDGELSAALEMELNVHRVNCAACRHDLALLEVAGDVIATDSPEAGLGEEDAAQDGVRSQA